MSRDQALAAASSPNLFVRRIDRISVKLTTWRVVASGTGADWKGAPDPDRSVWIIAVSGDITPHGVLELNSFPWAVFVYDATTGAVIIFQAGTKTAWPPYFDPIQDLGVCGDPIRTMSFRVGCGL
jgi:hypothetical protein